MPPTRSNNQIKTNNKISLQLQSDAGLVIGKRWDCWGNWKTLPHLSLHWCYLLKPAANREPVRPCLWLLETYMIQIKN